MINLLLLFGTPWEADIIVWMSSIRYYCLTGIGPLNNIRHIYIWQRIENPGINQKNEIEVSIKNRKRKKKKKADINKRGNNWKKKKKMNQLLVLKEDIPNNKKGNYKNWWLKRLMRVLWQQVNLGVYIVLNK